MEGGALFNSGVLGADFIWWIGQIADDSTWRDNMMSGKFPNKESIPGWGARYKVRIMGVHDQGQIIAEEDLPWANIIYPVTAGGGQTNSWMSSNLRQGNIVFGFYMDGKDMQNPVILGVMGNNAQTSLGFKIGKPDNAVTNTQPGQIAKSGYATGEDPPKGTKKPKVPDTGLVVTKPKSSEVEKESATPAPGTKLNQYGLNSANPITPTQQQDISSAKVEAQNEGLSGDAEKDFVKGKVQEGVRNRAGAANSPASEAKPGPTMEHPDNPHQTSSADVKTEDKLQEKIVLMKPDDAVGSATKAIQTEIDNLTAKVDKFMGSRKSYIDAVSGPPSQDELNKEIRNTAKKVSKYQKIIMDKVSEYQSKKMNDSLTKVVAAMPSSQRYMFADQKFLNTEENIKKYNEITNKMVDQMEGILRGKLNIGGLLKQVDKEAISGGLFADSSSQSSVGGLINLSDFSDDLGGDDSGVSGVGQVVDSGEDLPAYTPRTANQDINDIRTPSVPLCYAEDVVAQGIAVNKKAISDIAESQHRNFNRFLDGVKSQLNQQDKEMEGRSYDKTNLGKVVSFTDEEEDDLPQGGTNYYSENGAPTTGGSGTGFMVDIIVPDGGWYDNSFATINQEGAGYTVNTADGGGVSGTGSTTGATTTGGSGTGIQVNYTISGGKITGITTSAAGANYKNGDVLTIVNNASGTPSTNATFTLDKVRGTVNTVANGGIKINKPGNGYKIGDLLTVVQDGSGGNCGIVITGVVDPGEKKATAGPVTPGDTSGSVADAKPSIGQKLGDMLQMLGSMSGSMTQALDFENLKANVFPFENPANQAVSDFYTLATGGAGQPETELPSSMAIDKAVATVKDIAPSIPDIPFAGPTSNMPDINLISKKLGGLASSADALGINRQSTQDEIQKAIRKAKAKFDSGIA